MCHQLGELREALSHYVVGFEADRLTTADAAGVVSEAARLSSMAYVLTALAADRAADAQDFWGTGSRSAPEALARQVGTSNGAAADVLRLGRRLSCLDMLRQAAARGELSPSQTEMVAQAAEADASAEGRLVDLARSACHGELKEACQRTIAQADHDPERRRRRIHKQRCLSSWTDLVGTWHLRAKGNPEQGAKVLAALHPYKEAAFDRARQEGRHEPESAYAFDGLVAMATDSMAEPFPAPSTEARGSAADEGRNGTEAADGSEGSPAAAHGAVDRGTRERRRRGGKGHRGRSAAEVPACPSCPAPGAFFSLPRRKGGVGKVIVRVDLEALRRGFAKKGELCEIAGFGPVAPLAVREFIEQDDPFIAAVVTRGTDVLGVTHFGRKATAHQRTALEWLYPTCSVESCHARARLEIDHSTPWAQTHHTRLDELRCLCHWHHDLKSREGWDFVPDTNLFVPPTDPRHPRHRRIGSKRAGP